MAKLYPTTIPEDIPASEKQLLELILNNLDDEYTAVWSVKTVCRDESGRLVVGEADIVLLHPRRGMLVIEAKGGGIGYDGESRRYRVHDQYGGTHWIDNPYEQASARMYDILDRIREKNICQSPRGELPCPRGYAVVLPDSSIGSVDLPMDAPREITLDIDDLSFFQSRIERVYQHWKTGHNCRDLSGNEYKAILDRVLMPSYQLAYALSSEIRSAEQCIVQLTEEQCNLMGMLGDTKRALVCGAAGTGKTFLLMEKARRLTEQGKRVLVLCYNKPLSDHLCQMAKETGIPADVMTFHHLCRLVIESAGEDFSPPVGDDSQQFWKVDAPTRMFDLLPHYPDRWDAVLVDEGQDFDSSWWMCVESILSGSDNIFYVFYDPLQSIYDIESGLPFDQPRFPIETNCRNTRNICHLLKALDEECCPQPHKRAPAGRQPGFITYKEPARRLQAVDSLVDHLLKVEKLSPSQIAILSPRSQMHSLLSGRHNVGQCQLEEWKEHRGEGILFSSISRFKGMEADVVIVVDIVGGDDPTDPRQLYTAFSRAKQLLYVVHDETYQPPKVQYEPDSQPAPMP